MEKNKVYLAGKNEYRNIIKMYENNTQIKF